MLKLIFSEYDAYKVFQFNNMTAILLDFLTKKVKVRNCQGKTMVLFMAMLSYSQGGLTSGKSW